MRKFRLLHEDGQSYGLMTFNGKFTFTLNNDVNVDVWNRIGFIPLGTDGYIESHDLFAHLNSRLPITLRVAPNEEKLDYIARDGLRVASDGFYLQELGES